MIFPRIVPQFCSFSLAPIRKSLLAMQFASTTSRVSSCISLNLPHHVEVIQQRTSLILNTFSSRYLGYRYGPHGCSGKWASHIITACFHVVLTPLHSTPCYYHHIILSFWKPLAIKNNHTLCRICVFHRVHSHKKPWCNIWSYKLTHLFFVLVKIFVPHLIIIVKSDIWIISHCL